jgi:hypothetical protein
MTSNRILLTRLHRRDLNKKAHNSLYCHICSMKGLLDKKIHISELMDLYTNSFLQPKGSLMYNSYYQHHHMCSDLQDIE